MSVLFIDKETSFTKSVECLLNSYSPDINAIYSPNVFSAYNYIINDDSLNLILLSINEDSPEQSYDLIQRLYTLRINIPIIVISKNDSIEAANLAIENKVSGYISQKHSDEVILDSLIYVLEDNMFTQKRVTSIKIDSKNTHQDVEIPLQQTVMDLFDKGLRNKQIAAELNICSNTVKAHLHEVFRNELSI